MPKPKVHFLICANQRPPGHPRGCCAEKGAMDVMSAFAQRLQETQKFTTVMVSAVRSCLGPCGSGPIVAVYPDNVWYGNVTPDGVRQIFDGHVNGSGPVEGLLLAEGTF